MDDGDFEDDSIFEGLIPNGVFQGFLDQDADKAGVVARELLKYEVNVMYEMLDKYIKWKCDKPMASYIKDSII